MSNTTQTMTKLPKVAVVFVVSFVTMFVIASRWTSMRDGELSDPPAPWNVDGIFYDNIAFNLNRGKGFIVDLQAQPWRDSYMQYGTKANRIDLNYKWLSPVKGTGPTALRSPAYPFLLSKIDKAFGRDHRIARTFGAGFVAAGLALLLTFCVCRWGYIAAFTAAVTLSLDFSVMNSAGTLATEALAILLFAVTFLLIARAWESPTYTRWAIAGISFACLMLTRGIWSLGWLILVVVAVFCLIPAINRRWESLQPHQLLVFVAMAATVAMPWWIRNCQVTGHFTPFGTAGSCGFVGGYCDESLANYGQWQADVYNKNQMEVQKNFDMDTANLAHIEYAIGQSSMNKTLVWCQENWNRVPELMLNRAISHWGFFNPAVPFYAQLANLWLVVIGLVGCFLCTGKLRRLFIFVLILDTVLVMLTWEHLGRYGIPIRPVVHLGYGLAISNFLRWAWLKLTRNTKAAL